MSNTKAERTNDTNRVGKQEKATITVSRAQREHDPSLDAFHRKNYFPGLS